MLPEFPVDGRRKKAGVILGAVISCGYGAYVVLTGPPAYPQLPAFRAWAGGDDVGALARAPNWSASLTDVNIQR